MEVLDPVSGEHLAVVVDKSPKAAGERCPGIRSTNYLPNTGSASRGAWRQRGNSKVRLHAGFIDRFDVSPL